MSPVDETLEVVVKPKRASRRRVTATVKANTEEISVPTSRVSKKQPPAEPRNETVVMTDVKIPKKTRTTKEAASVKEKPVVAKSSRATSVKTEKKESVLPDRKAPTQFAAKKAASKTLRRQVVVVGLLLCIGVGASAAIGRTDRGQIDVTKVITERNDRITRGEEQGEVIPAQNTPTLPDGGLIGLGTNGPVDGAPSSTASTAASSTATSTPPTSDGNVPMTNAEAEAAAAAYKASHGTSTSQ